jgi:hypothetical protein
MKKDEKDEKNKNLSKVYLFQVFPSFSKFQIPRTRETESASAPSRRL